MGWFFPLWGFRCSIALHTPPRWGNRSRHISSISQLSTNTPGFNQKTWLWWMLDTHGHVRCPRTGHIIHEACLNSKKSHILPHTQFLARSRNSTVYYLAQQPAILWLSFTLETCVGWKKKEKLKQVTVVLPCITCQRRVIVCQNLAYVLHFADRKGTVECGVTLVMVITVCNGDGEELLKQMFTFINSMWRSLCRKAYGCTSFAVSRPNIYAVPVACTTSVLPYHQILLPPMLRVSVFFQWSRLLESLCALLCM